MTKIMNAVKRAFRALGVVAFALGAVAETYGSDVAERIELTAESGEKEYDGELFELDEYEITGGSLVEGDVLEVVVEGDIVDVGTESNVITSVAILRDGVDVTDRYAVTLIPGELTVRKVSTPLVVTAKPVRLADGSANGFSVSGGALVAGDEVFAEVAVTTNDDGIVVCRIASCEVCRDSRNITSNYTIETRDSSVVDDPDAEYTAVTSSKEIPKVGKNEEVSMGTEENPAVIDFKVKNPTFTVGANATYALVGEMRNATTVKVAAGKKAKVDGVTAQGTTVADLGTLVGTSALASGSYADVSLAYLSGTKKADKVTVGAKTVFLAGDIDLGAGSDRLSVGAEATFEAGDLYDVETLSFASRSTNRVGNVVGVQKLTVSSGKSATSKAAAVPTVLVAGDVGMPENKAGVISLGGNTDSTFGDLQFGAKNDKLTVGAGARAFFGRVDFGGGKDSFTVGKNGTVVVVADAEDAASLTKFTIDAGTTAYLSSELIAKGRKLVGARVFGSGAKLVDLGAIDIACRFTTLDDERSDNAAETARPISGGVSGWLSDVAGPDGVALDADDFFVAERRLAFIATVTDGNEAKMSLSINGTRIVTPFGRRLVVRKGGILGIHKNKGDGVVGYTIAEQ